MTTVTKTAKIIKPEHLFKEVAGILVRLEKGRIEDAKKMAQQLVGDTAYHELARQEYANQFEEKTNGKNYVYACLNRYPGEAGQPDGWTTLFNDRGYEFMGRSIFGSIEVEQWSWGKIYYANPINFATLQSYDMEPALTDYGQWLAYRFWQEYEGYSDEAIQELRTYWEMPDEALETDYMGQLVLVGKKVHPHKNVLLEATAYLESN